MGNKLIGILMVFIGAMGAFLSFSGYLVTYDNIILNILSRLVVLGISILLIVIGLKLEEIMEELTCEKNL